MVADWLSPPCRDRRLWRAPMSPGDIGQQRSGGVTSHLCSVLLATALSLCLGCGEEEGGANATAGRSGRGGGYGPEGGRGPAAAIPVRAEPVARQDMHAYMETYARLEAERQVSVLARATGLVQQLSVEEGDFVTEGQLLVELDRAQASLQLRQSQAALDEARANYERFQVLSENNMVSQSEFETTRLRYNNSRISLEDAQLNLTYTSIKAPISGVLTRRMVELGDLVRGNQEIFVVADLDLLLVRMFIPERRMYQVEPGQRATISVEALPDQTFEGQIRMISPEVIPESGTVKVTLEVPADGLLRPGMFATVRLITDRHPQTLVIPKKALVLETEDDDVFKIVDSKVQLVQVEIGLAQGDRVEVLAGLEIGDLLVTVGHDGLKDGTAVRVVGQKTTMAASAGDSLVRRPANRGDSP
ncbi:MAG TPA: efflux RND transporter periplasmic adaptor subunit [Candidatus Latescibacteria bacterium]|nr:efflux RND transporter periplasmic adaptor subunit [Candidatus Latescibacterota bacterium]